MSVPTHVIRFSLSDGGTPIPLDAVPTLADPTATYGVRRTDTLEVLVPTGTTMTEESPGVYRYVMIEPPEGVEIEYSIMYELDGLLHFHHGVVTIQSVDSNLPHSPYHTYIAFEHRWGRPQIAAASNLSGSSRDPNYEMVQMAFDHAVSRIHMEIRGGVVDLPESYPSYDDVPPVVREWAMVYGYEFLYNARGIDNKDRQGNRIRAMARMIMKEISAVRAGLMQIQAPRPFAASGEAVDHGFAALQPTTGSCYG